MARPLFALAVGCCIALVALRFVLGLASMAGFLFGLLLKLAVVVALIYFGILLVSPDTARKMREHWLGPSA